MAGRMQQRRPRSAGQGRSRADWNYPDVQNEYSDRTFSPRSRPASRELLRNDHQDDNRRESVRFGSGLPAPDCNDVSPQARENRLGLHRLDRGFVPGCRFPPGSGTGRLTTFDRLGFGQEPERIQYVDFDDHAQASHPILHRHAPLGMPRRLGSGPDEYSTTACDSTHPRRYGNRGAPAFDSTRPRGFGNGPRVQQNLSPRGNASRGPWHNSHTPVNHRSGPGHRRQHNSEHYSPSNPAGGWSPSETYSPSMPEWSSSPGAYPHRPFDLPEPHVANNRRYPDSTPTSAADNSLSYDSPSPDGHYSRLHPQDTDQEHIDL